MDKIYCPTHGTQRPRELGDGWFRCPGRPLTELASKSRPVKRRAGQAARCKLTMRGRGM